MTHNHRSENTNSSPSNPSDLTHLPSSHHPAPNEGDTINLILWRSHWLILGSVLLALAVAVGYLKFSHTIFEATTVYEIFPSRAGSLQQRIDGGGVIDLERAFLNQKTIGLFQEREFLAYFLDSTGMVPLILPELYNPSSDTYALPDDKLSPSEFAAARLLNDTKNPIFDFETDKASGVTRLTVQYPDPQLAAGLANDGLRWANDYLRDQETKHLQQQKATLQQAFVQLGLSEENLILPTNKLEKKTVVSGAVLESLQQRLVDRQIELGVMERTNPTSSTLPELKAEISVLEERLTTLQQQSQQQLQTRMGEAEEVARLRIQLAQTEARLQQLEREDAQLIRIVDRAIPPENPTKPNARLILALSLVLGLFGGIFLVFFIDFVRKARQRGLT